MPAPLSKALTSPAAGPAALSLAVVLGIALAVSTSQAARRQSQLKAQVAALAARNEQTSLYWRAQVSSCRAQAAAPAPTPGAITRVAASGDAVAAQLATRGPAGFDVCARMEAADQAVLASLHAK
ncbi:hypothetical protein [Phenylobacterium sp.]|uniref:hypothetical protein n=1 Tax=Phenylobacterium sp. TaxID=1871053 RepID=UPI002DEAFC09|nr:hypothetical protein [Phenylobacterium sp.]